MGNCKGYVELTLDQVEALQGQGCCAEDWGDVRVAEGFDTDAVVNVSFIGKVCVGKLAGKIKDANGLEKSCGIYNAVIADCCVGANSRIANVGVHIANYDIGENVCIENVGTMQTNPGSEFGNGLEVDVLNEAGGREVVLFNELSVQFAYLMCLHRYKPKLIEKLKEMASNYAKSIRADRGKVSAGARICSTPEIIDVNIGEGAVVNAASKLINGTILSSGDAVTVVGDGVIAEEFIIAESSTVTGGAIIDKVFVGQGCQVGKQFSAENSLFFANSEAFHGEACSVFGGPYSVSHHKSTLLIAAMVSFYNAGSGTNQSNHMYKLGPVHEGKLERGTKTGSFSYMMWPCRTGPFSVVLGKHSSTFDTSDFPFSHLDARSDGKCNMVPGLHLTTVGTVRDGAKWPSRDRRKGSVKRDIISFDVFSPYTVGKMLKASAKLKEIHTNTEKTIEEVSVHGAMVRRPILRTGQKYYRTGIEMYLLEKVIEKAEKGLRESAGDIGGIFAVDPAAVYSDSWVDIGGQMMPSKRLADFEDAIENGTIATVEDFAKEAEKINDAYSMDEWVWVKNTYKEHFGVDIENASKDDIVIAADMLLKVKGKFLSLVIADSEKEFAELGRCGFGQDGRGGDVEEDFRRVRGEFEENKFVKDMKTNIDELHSRIERLKQKVSTL